MRFPGSQMPSPASRLPIAPGTTVGIVGAGIVGVACAFELAARGYHVTLFDRDDPGRFGPSFGNAGHIAGSELFPLSGPRIAFDAVRMLADRDGPLKIPLAHAPKLVPWLWSFLLAGRASAHERSTMALTELSANAFQETDSLFRRAKMSDQLRRDPALYLYESDRSYEHAKPGWERKGSAGRSSTHVTQAKLGALEPALASIFKHGVLSHEWGIVSDPYEVVRGLFEAGRQLGVVFRRARIERLECHDRGPLLHSGASNHRFEAILVAAGVWSRGLAASLGEQLPLEAERGYNLTYPALAASIRRPLVFADRGVVATSLSSGLRLGGWAEFGGISRPPSASHFNRLRRIARTLLPCLNGGDAAQWMGHRPSLPDSVPVLSRSARDSRIFYATGHGHYGLSYAAKSARIMADLISGKASDSRYSAYSMRRFA